MKTTIYDDCKWGVDAAEGGVMINLFHEESKELVQVPFTGAAHLALATGLLSSLSPEDRSKVIQEATGGLVVADQMPPNGNGN